MVCLANTNSDCHRDIDVYIFMEKVEECGHKTRRRADMNVCIVLNDELWYAIWAQVISGESK